MSRARPLPLAEASALHALRQSGDYLDCFGVPSDLPVRVAAERAVRFPAAAAGLLALRNILVRPFGLATDHGPVPRIGPFPILAETDSEIVVGLDDRHLDFRIALIRQGDMAYAATWMRPHNVWGRAYLAGVMPVHLPLMRGAAARMATRPA